MFRPARSALLILSAALVFYAAVERRVEHNSHAAPVKAEMRVASFERVSFVTLHQQSGDKKGAQDKAPAVSEIDVAGLKKLLERDPQTARPLLINFWATWCEPCRAEFPDLVRIDQEYRSRNLDFITVSIDEVSEIKTSVPKFLLEMRARMPAYLLNTPEQDAAITAVDPTWGGSLPATFLFDPQGRIVFRHLGRIKPEELRAALNQVISNK